MDSDQREVQGPVVPQTVEVQQIVMEQQTVIEQTVMEQPAVMQQLADGPKKAGKKAGKKVSVEDMEQNKVLVAEVSKFYNGISEKNDLGNKFKDLRELSNMDEEKWKLNWNMFKEEAQPKRRHHRGLNDLYNVLLEKQNISINVNNRKIIRSKTNNLVRVFKSLHHHLVIH